MGKTKMDNFTIDELNTIVENSWSIQEVLRQLGYSVNSGANGKTVKTKLAEYGIDISHFSGRAKDQIKRNEENIFVKNSSASQATLRRWYLKGNYSEYKCSICDMEPIWQGKELSLTLDHINGDNKDNVLENLRWVCPNCDRQLETFGSKNKRD